MVFQLNVATRDIALTASMAALIVALGRMPGLPVIGVEGAQIGIVSCIVPIFGFLMGPWLGASAAFFGGVISRILFGATPFSWLTLPSMTLSAFIAGCLSRQRLRLFRGWICGAIAIGGLIAAWYLTKVGQIVLVYPILHWAALGIILIFRGWLAYFIQYGEKLELTVCIYLAGFVSTMVAHMYGTLAFLMAMEFRLIGIPPSALLFLGLIPVVAVERLAITAITTVLGVPILLALRRDFFLS